jgi:hypothetical protein
MQCACEEQCGESQGEKIWTERMLGETYPGLSVWKAITRNPPPGRDATSRRGGFLVFRVVDELNTPVL